MKENSKNAILKHGLAAQMEIMIEELAELTQAICKIKRHNMVSDHGIIVPTEESSTKQTKAYTNLHEEVADVIIVLEQLKSVLNPTLLQEYLDAKNLRLSGIIGKVTEPEPVGTEFYRSIPPEILPKLREYCDKFGDTCYIKIEYSQGLGKLFAWGRTPELYGFWNAHWQNKTFPKWSEELNRFID